VNLAEVSWAGWNSSSPAAKPLRFESQGTQNHADSFGLELTIIGAFRENLIYALGDVLDGEVCRGLLVRESEKSFDYNVFRLVEAHRINFFILFLQTADEFLFEIHVLLKWDCERGRNLQSTGIQIVRA
jgi:hypothetical protein